MVEDKSSQKTIDEQRRLAELQRAEQLREYADLLDRTEIGNPNDIKVNAKEEQEMWIYYESDKTGPKKFLLKYVRIPYEEHLNVTIKAWEKSGHDVKLFSLLFQAEHMKRTWISLGGIPCGPSFWVEVSPDIIEAGRSMLYPPDEIQPKPDAEMIKNLVGALQSLLANTGFGPSTLTQNSPDDRQHLNL